MSLLLVGPGDLCGAEVDGWINSRAGQRGSTDRGLTAAFNPPLAAGRHPIATFTLGVAPKPGVQRMLFHAGVSPAESNDRLWLQSPPLTITVQAP